jgi:hypothetical protein
MRLPQPILQPLAVRAVCLLTIGMAIAVFAMAPLSAAAATPQLTCTPSNLRFGAVTVGSTTTLLLAITNNGETSVTVSGMSVTNSEFTPSFTPSSLNLPVVLTAGQSVDLSVSFTPTARGWTGGLIKFSSDASNPTLDLVVGGAGALSELVTASPSVVSFGQVATGTSSASLVVITNARSSSVTISGFQTTGNGFSIIQPTLPLILGVGQSVTLSVTFAPQGVGTGGGSLFVYGPGLAIPLTGTGAAPQYSVNLFWNSSQGVSGYNVYRSTTAHGTYSRINSTLDPNAAFTDSTVVSGQTYYYAATSVSSNGQESARSTPPAQATVP